MTSRRLLRSAPEWLLSTGRARTRRRRTAMAPPSLTTSICGATARCPCSASVRLPIERATPARNYSDDVRPPDKALTRGRALSAAGAGAPPPSRFRPAGEPGLESAGGRGPASGEGLAQGTAMGAQHGPARRRMPDRQKHPDLRARRAAAFRRHQYLPEGALCGECARRLEI